MRKSTLIVAVSTLLCGAALASPAMAQDTTRKSSAGEVANAKSLASLIAALDATTANAAKIGTLATLKAEDVELINAMPLVMEKEADFNAARDRNTAGITELRTAIGKNDVLVKALAENEKKLTPDDVLAVQVQANGHVIVYYMPKM